MRRTLAALAIAGGLIVLRGGVLAAPAAPLPVDPATAAAAKAAPEEAAEGSHGGPVVPVLLGLVVILGAAKLGGELCERIGQPAVLGELVFGVVLGNLALAHVRQGDVDAAAGALHQAIDLVGQTRGAGGLNLIFKATRELAPWRQEPVVHHVHDRVHDLMTAP